MAVHVLPEIAQPVIGLEGLDDETLRPGQIIGRYRIVRRIAVGGMAELYLAYATGVEGFEKLVAIKRVQPTFAIDPEFVSMFLDEARLAATLSHPNIAQVYDVGVDGHSYFFAMEFVDGRDVRHLLREAVHRGERLPLAIAIGIAGGVAAGLHAAHENRAADRTPLRIVHRDVSPGNVLVTFGGAVKLIDFGIAKAARRRTVTQAGQLKGKAGYMSPEQCTGTAIDRRSDIFALGVLLYELTTTRRLFAGGDEYATMRMIVDGRISPPSRVVADYPAELEAILMRALARDPDDRYQTARDLHLDLVRFARACDLDVTEYDLAAYVERLMPEQQAESILRVALDDDGDDGPAIAAALRTPSVAPLAVVRARAASMAETRISTRDEAQATTIYLAPVEPPDRPPARRIPPWRLLALFVLGVAMFAVGWSAAAAW